jgi:outer membrane biogenesis lipoprotein LolB
MTLRGTGVLLSLALVYAACAPTRESLLLDTQRIPPDRLMATVLEAETQIATFTGRGSLAFDAPELSGSVFFTIAIRKPDSVLVHFEGPFGMDVGFLFASRNRFVLYNAMENWYVNEPANSAGIRSVLPFDLSFDQLIDAFTGTFRLPAGRQPARYAIDDDRFLLVFPEGSDSSSYWIDPALRAVTQYRISHKDSTVVEASADRWTEDDGRAMPRHITMTFPHTSRAVSVFYSAVHLNPEVPSFAYSVPSRARRRMLQ